MLKWKGRGMALPTCEVCGCEGRHLLLDPGFLRFYLCDRCLAVAESEVAYRLMTPQMRDDLNDFIDRDHREPRAGTQAPALPTGAHA